MININLTKNKLTKRSLGLVIMVGFAFMGVIACPTGGGGDTPASGDAVRCTTTDTSLAEVTNPTASTSTMAADSITLTWTEPADSDSTFTGVEISGGTPALASPIMVAAGTQTTTITGVAVGTLSTYTVKSMYGTNCSRGETASVTLPLPEVTNQTATPATVVTGPNDAGRLTLTWTQPAVSGFTGVEISGGTPALANPIMIAAGTQTKTITGLTIATASTFTIKSMYGEKSSTGVTASGTTPNGAIALFSLGKQDGDFGFMACQTAIEDTANSNLRDRGYTQARFYGSTDSYDFIDIHTDTDALGISGVTIGGYTMVAFTDLTGTTAPTTTFAPNVRTLSEILTISGLGNDLSDVAKTVVAAVTGTLTNDNGVWTFNNNASGMYSTIENCDDAMSNAAGVEGTRVRAASSVAIACNTEQHALCVAR